MTLDRRCLYFLMILPLASAPAFGEPKVTTVSVVFAESAPKDSFTITNLGQCQADTLQLQIDLASSSGRLIFDPTDSGAGVEVFQPLVVTAGKSHLLSVSEVRDGSQDVSLKLKSLPPGAKVSFTTDVDDTLPGGRSDLGQTRVSNAEIYGARVHGESGNGTAMKATFGSDATARLTRVPCA